MLNLNIKKFLITNEGVTILDNEIVSKINKKKLSPSMINAYNDSPAEWVLNEYIKPLVTTEEEIHFARGHWYHSIMEKFLTKEKRNLETLKETTKEVTNNNEDYKNLARLEENQNWLKRTLKGFIQGNEEHDFFNMKLLNTFYQGKNCNGVEMFVNTKFDNFNHQVLGFIDCIIETPNGLRIIDWKTGSWHKGDKGYKTQQTLYSLILEQDGYKVDSACLFFPIGNNGEAITEWIDIKNPQNKEETLNILREVDKNFQFAKDNGYFFPFKKCQWNNWQSFLLGIGKTPKPKIDEDKFFALADIRGIK